MEKIKWIEDYLKEASRLLAEEGHEAALRLLDKLLYEEPGYGRLHNLLGVIYFYCADEIAKAEIHFRAAILLDPRLAEPYEHYAKLLHHEERLNDAIGISKKGLRAKQANKQLLLENVGQAYELKKEFRKAIKHYRKALTYTADLWNGRILDESIKRCKRKQK